MKNIQLSSILNFKYKPLIAGVDEVGRGSLLGPVVSGAVILKPVKSLFCKLYDSKKITKKHRVLLYQDIISNALSWGIGYSSEQEIDRLNILQATLLSMKRAIMRLSIKPDILLIDGVYCPLLSILSMSIVKGDSKIPEISAASILAKVTRDMDMDQLDNEYPEYGLSQNKGYPTKFHISRLKLYGMTKYHRRTFNIVKQCFKRNIN